MLEELIRDKTVIFSASEAKLGSSFLVGQIMIKGYSTPFRLDGNQNEIGQKLKRVYYFTHAKTAPKFF